MAGRFAQAQKQQRAKGDSANTQGAIVRKK